MKKFLKTITLGLFFTTAAFAQSSGRLEFTVTSAAIPGNYAPKHIIAIWVVDSEGSYINSMAVYGEKRLQYLTNWKAASNSNKADAVTGATISSFRAYNVTWNLKDYSGNLVPDGTYTIWMEATSRNSTGVKYSVDVVVGRDNYVTNPTGNSNFKSMTVNYTANDNTPISKVKSTTEFKVFPNPSLDIINLEFLQSNAEYMTVRLLDLSGHTCEELYSGQIKPGLNALELVLDKSIPKGNYIINAQTNSYSWSKEIILQ